MGFCSIFSKAWATCWLHKNTCKPSEISAYSINFLPFSWNATTPAKSMPKQRAITERQCMGKRRLDTPGRATESPAALLVKCRCCIHLTRNPNKQQIFAAGRVPTKRRPIIYRSFTSPPPQRLFLRDGKMSLNRSLITHLSSLSGKWMITFKVCLSYVSYIQPFVFQLADIYLKVGLSA